MKIYSIVSFVLVSVFILAFLALEASQIPLLSDPSDWMQQASWIAVIVGFGLLVLDVFLPVPSSLVMIAHGSLFGIVGGTILSLLGSVGATVLGAWLGRRGGTWLNQHTEAEERRQAEALLQKWGTLAIIVTRPIPILAETMAVLAGMSRMTWRSLLLASLLGSFPAALLFAITGATAANFDNLLFTFGLVILIAGCFWILRIFFEKKLIQ